MTNAQFDREQVLRAAMKAFMYKGYGKTSMQDLKKVTGLHPGSIYCAFDNKRGLLIAALEQYRLDRSVEFQAFFPSSQPVMISLKNYLNDIVQGCLNCDAPQACLLTKALSEISEQDEEIQQIIAHNLQAWQQALAEKLEQAKIQHELTTTRDSDHLARFFVMGIYGLRTFAHTYPKTDVLQQLADQLYSDICA